MRWWRGRSKAASDAPSEAPLALSEDDMEAMRKARSQAVNEAAALLEEEDETQVYDGAQPVPTPEYDAGHVEAATLLDQGADLVDHHELNVVVHEDLDGLEDPLEQASIDGDLPQPVDLD